MSISSFGLMFGNNRLAFKRVKGSRNAPQTAHPSSTISQIVCQYYNIFFLLTYQQKNPQSYVFSIYRTALQRELLKPVSQNTSLPLSLY